jgi:hypothetical protein
MQMGENIDERDKRVELAKKDITNVTSIFQTQNKQLTEVLAKYR